MTTFTIDTAKSKFIKPVDRYEGFGALDAYGEHIFRVDVLASTGDVTVLEDYGLKGGERGVPFHVTRAVLPCSLWPVIAEVARKDFTVRLKAEKKPSSRWTVSTKLDRMLGKELCVLVWAAEHATSPAECKAIAARWAALLPMERWWLFNQTVAEAGGAGDKDGGWRKALYCALSGPLN
jgi:hypothetical protein